MGQLRYQKMGWIGLHHQSYIFCWEILKKSEESIKSIIHFFGAPIALKNSIIISEKSLLPLWIKSIQIGE
jgi:hypothetical protein